MFSQLMAVEDERYAAAAALAAGIDAHLVAGTGHFRDQDGRLMRNLDQVVRAILENRWPWNGESANGESASQRVSEKANGDEGDG